LKTKNKQRVALLLVVYIYIAAEEISRPN
jgi:hypothetical protein